MNPRDVASKRFEKGFGYKQEDVDSFLKEIAVEYANAVREKEENEAKIVKLVEKINEYRSDESAIGNALLIAQKQANRIIVEAQDEAAKIVSEAQAKRDAMIAEIAGDCETVKRTQIEKIALAIKGENDRLSAVTAASAERTEQARQQLNSLKAEITEFKLKLLAIFEEQVKLTAELPEISEDEINKILSGQVKPANQPEYVAEPISYAAADSSVASLTDPIDKGSDMSSGINDTVAAAATSKKPSAAPQTFNTQFGSNSFEQNKKPDSSHTAPSLGFSEIDYKKQDHSYGDLKFGQNTGNKGKK